MNTKSVFYYTGHLEVSQLLIKAGANVNASDLWQFTPLHEAASKSRIEVCSLLISENADINFLNCHNKSPLDLASRELQEKMTCKCIVITTASVP
jgi:tankyrase